MLLLVHREEILGNKRPRFGDSIV